MTLIPLLLWIIDTMNSHVKHVNITLNTTFNVTYYLDLHNAISFDYQCNLFTE